MIKPTIGRRVWFYPGTLSAFNTLSDQALEAGVIHVNDNRNVNLIVTDHVGQIQPVLDVPLFQGDDEDKVDVYRGCYCKWMPYQQAQPGAQASTSDRLNAIEKLLAASGKIDAADLAHRVESLEGRQGNESLFAERLNAVEETVHLMSTPAEPAPMTDSATASVVHDNVGN